MEIYNVTSPVDFSIFMDGEIKNINKKIPPEIIELVVEFGELCFMEGFRVGKLPINQIKGNQNG